MNPFGEYAALRRFTRNLHQSPLSYYQDFGGATKLNGVSQNDRMNNGRLQLGFSTFVSPTIQLQAQYGQATKVENGAKEANRFNLRIAKVF